MIERLGTLCGHCQTHIGDCRYCPECGRVDSRGFFVQMPRVSAERMGDICGKVNSDLFRCFQPGSLLIRTISTKDSLMMLDIEPIRVVDGLYDSISFRDLFESL